MYARQEINRESADKGVICPDHKRPSKQAQIKLIWSEDGICLFNKVSNPGLEVFGAWRWDQTGTCPHQDRIADDVPKAS